MSHSAGYEQPRYGCDSEQVFVAVPSTPLCYVPSSRARCYKPLSRASVQSTAAFDRLVAGRVCCKTPRFCHKPCRKKAARACLKPDVLRRCHIYTHIIRLRRHNCTFNPHPTPIKRSLNRGGPESESVLPGPVGTSWFGQGPSQKVRRKNPKPEFLHVSSGPNCIFPV